MNSIPERFPLLAWGDEAEMENWLINIAKDPWRHQPAPRIVVPLATEVFDALAQYENDMHEVTFDEEVLWRETYQHESPILGLRLGNVDILVQIRLEHPETSTLVDRWEFFGSQALTFTAQNGRYLHTCIGVSVDMREHQRPTSLELQSSSDWVQTAERPFARLLCAQAEKFQRSKVDLTQRLLHCAVLLSPADPQWRLASALLDEGNGPVFQSSWTYSSALNSLSSSAKPSKPEPYLFDDGPSNGHRGTLRLTKVDAGAIFVEAREQAYKVLEDRAGKAGEELAVVIEAGARHVDLLGAIRVGHGLMRDARGSSCSRFFRQYRNGDRWNEKSPVRAEEARLYQPGNWMYFAVRFATSVADRIGPHSRCFAGCGPWGREVYEHGEYVRRLTADLVARQLLHRAAKGKSLEGLREVYEGALRFLSNESSDKEAVGGVPQMNEGFSSNPDEPAGLGEYAEDLATRWVRLWGAGGTPGQARRDSDDFLRALLARVPGLKSFDIEDLLLSLKRTVERRSSEGKRELAVYLDEICRLLRELLTLLSAAGECDHRFGDRAELLRRFSLDAFKWDANVVKGKIVLSVEVDGLPMYGGGTFAQGYEIPPVEALAADIFGERFDPSTKIGVSDLVEDFLRGQFIAAEMES